MIRVKNISRRLRPAVLGLAFLHAQSLRAEQPITAVNSNAEMRSSVAFSHTLMRIGFYEAGDSPPVTYTHSASACPRADLGLQVPAADKGCWIANLDRSQPIDARIFGVKCDDIADDGRGFSNAMYAVGQLGGGRVYVPATGKGCRIATGVEMVGNGVGLVGNGDHEWGGTIAARATWMSVGSWLDCADKARSCVKFDGDGFVEGVNFWQDHPIPGVGWRPTQYPWAIEFLQNFSHTRNVEFANIYDGLYFHGSAGSNIYGSASYFDDSYFGTFHTAVRIDKANDTMSCHNFHASLQWQINSPGIQNWITQKSIGMDLRYVDGMMCSNVEFYKTAKALLFTNERAPCGTAVIEHAAARLEFTNVQFNLVPQAIAISSNTTVLSLSMNNVTGQSDTDNARAAPCFVDLQTPYADVDIDNFVINSVGYSIACVGTRRRTPPDSGGGSRLYIYGIETRGAPQPGGGLVGYDYRGGGKAAFYVAAGNTISIPTGWQDIKPANAYSGPLIACIPPLPGEPVAPDCSSIEKPTFPSFPQRR